MTALHLAGAAPDGSDQEILRYGYTDGHLTEVVNSSGRPLRFGCDEHGRITSWTDTNGSRFDYVYDDRDRCTYQTGTNGHVESRFTWGDTDPETGLRTTSLTNGQGHTKRFVVDGRSKVVAEIDPWARPPASRTTAGAACCPGRIRWGTSAVPAMTSRAVRRPWSVRTGGGRGPSTTRTAFRCGSSAPTATPCARPSTHAATARR